MANQNPVPRRWVSSIVGLFRLPPPGTQVFYFGRGHAEQWPVGPDPLEHGILCDLTGIEYFTDCEDPCARITLLPRDNNLPPVADDHNPPMPGRFLFFDKTIRQTDKQRSYFSIPKACETIFQPFQAGENKQDFVMRDISGLSWNMVRKEGTMRTLGNQWRDFVRDKGPEVDDTIVFVGCPHDDKILVDVRRAAPQDIEWGDEEVAQASQLAIQGNAFTVTYYPGRVTEPFIVPRAVVDAAAGTDWEVGMPVRLLPKDEVVHLREGGAAAGVTRRGTIAAVIAGAEAGPTWRSLQVDWDDSSASPAPAAPMNMWRVEPEETRDAKRRRLSHDVPPVASTGKQVKLFGINLVPQGSGSN